MPFLFKISRYMIERCMKDEQEEREEETKKYQNIFNWYDINIKKFNKNKL